MGFGWCWGSMELYITATPRRVRRLTLLTHQTATTFLADIQGLSYGTAQCAWRLFGVNPATLETFVSDSGSYRTAIEAFAYGKDSILQIVIDQEGDQVFESLFVSQLPSSSLQSLLTMWSAQKVGAIVSTRSWQEAYINQLG